MRRCRAVLFGMPMVKMWDENAPKNTCQTIRGAITTAQRIICF